MPTKAKEVLVALLCCGLQNIVYLLQARGQSAYNESTLGRAYPGWKGTCRRAVFGGYCVFWRYTAHYTRLTAKFLAGHAQVRTSAHERAGTNGQK